MREIKVKSGDFILKEKVIVVYEKVVTPFGNSAKVDVQKKYIGKRAYVIIVKRMKKQIEKKIKEGIYLFENVPCCVCGGENFELLSEKDRYGLYVPVVICKDCGLIYTNPRMTQDAFNQFYELEYRK